MIGQSQRLQQVPYGRRKLKLQKKLHISLKIYILLRFLRKIPQTLKTYSLIYFKILSEGIFNNNKYDLMIIN